MIYWFLHGFVASILLRAGIGKLLRLRDFYWQIRATATFPRPLEPTAAYTIPILECVAGGGVLASPLTGWWPDLLALALLATFTFYSIWIAATGRRVRCFCFGRDDGEIGWMTVFRNAILVVLLLAAAVCHQPHWGFQPVALSALDGFTASLMLIAIFQLYSIRREFENA